MKINCIIIEDEPLAEEKLIGFIDQVPFLNLLSSFDNALGAIQFLNTNNTDLVFLDIQMKGFNGIQFLQAIKDPPEIIITSAYDEYALKCYEFSVADYLLKPFSLQRFVQAVEKVSHAIKERQEPIKKDYIFVKTEYRIEKIVLGEILFVEGMKDYVRIHTSAHKTMSLMSMKAILDMLPAKTFIRTHKSYIVSVDKIESIERNRIKIGEKLIPIGETFKKDFYDKIGIGN